MAAKIAYELHVLGAGCRALAPGARGQLALLASEDLDLGAAEPIDRLLGIAHRAERTAALAREERDEVDLLLVGILELVDHHHLEPAGVLRADALVVAQGLVGEPQQITVVEQGALLLECAVLALHRAGKGAQLLERGAAARKETVHRGIGYLGREQVNLLLGERLARARLLARQDELGHIGLRPCALQKALAGIKRALGDLGTLAACADERPIGIHERGEVETPLYELDPVHAVGKR